jgi:hypothetical protein
VVRPLRGERRDASGLGIPVLGIPDLSARRGRLLRSHGGDARPGQHPREDPGPAEHRGEGDHLEEREVDRGGDEQPRSGEQEHEDESGRDREAAVQAVHQHGRRDQQGGETEHHHAGDLVVQVLVAVQGHAAHEREVDPDHGEAQESDRRGSPSTRSGSESAQFATHPHGVDDDEHAADLERVVEQGARHVVERPELAEVQVPPQRIGRGEDRRQDAAHQHDQDQSGQLHGGEGAHPACQAARYREHLSGKGKGGRAGNGWSDRDAHFRALSLGADRKSPGAARPSASVGLLG